MGLATAMVDVTLRVKSQKLRRKNESGKKLIFTPVKIVIFSNLESSKIALVVFFRCATSFLSLLSIFLPPVICFCVCGAYFILR